MHVSLILLVCCIYAVVFVSLSLLRPLNLLLIFLFRFSSHLIPFSLLSFTLSSSFQFCFRFVCLVDFVAFLLLNAYSFYFLPVISSVLALFHHISSSFIFCRTLFFYSSYLPLSFPATPFIFQKVSIQNCFMVSFTHKTNYCNIRLSANICGFTLEGRYDCPGTLAQFANILSAKLTKIFRTHLL